MITQDIYGKPLSQAFQTATNSYAQKVKPKVVVTLLDSRHVDNLVVTSNDSYPSNSRGTLASQMAGNSMLSGYFFTPSQSMNGIPRQAFPWAIAGDVDQNGKTICADGSFYAMPSDLEDNYKYGWRSNAVSTSTAHETSGFQFTTPIWLNYAFTQRKTNKIKIVTSEFGGKISYYKLEISNNALSTFHTVYASIGTDEYYREHIIPSGISNDVSGIKITIYSTQTQLDNARLIEVIPLYEVDMTDYVINHSIQRQGELWENSIPIAGSGSSSASITLDNTTKAFSPFNVASAYGKYMKKDLKVDISNGWRIVKTDDILVNAVLTSSMTTSSNSLTVNDAAGFLDGNATNQFTLLIDKGNANEEIVLCTTRTDKTVQILTRGYAGTYAASHSVGASVVFDPYEYINAGEFYIDEWTGGSSMEVSVKCLDKTKFLTEKQVTKGFYVQNSTVGQAVKNMLMQTNISQNELSQLVPYSDFLQENAVASYSFKEDLTDKTGTNIVPGTGLRLRYWRIEDNKLNELKDIKADALDAQLSAYDKALKVKSFTPQSNTKFTKDIEGALYALDLQNESFNTADVPPVNIKQYFNGVANGFWIPSQSGNMSFEIVVTAGGVRAYLDDNLVLNKWTETTGTISSYDFLGDYINVDAGVPYKIRVEFFHGKSDTAIFDIALYKKYQGGSAVKIPLSETTTVVVEDSIGKRNVTFTKNSKNRNHYRNNGVYVSDPVLKQPSGLVSEPLNKAVYLDGSSYIRIPYDQSLNLANSSSTNYTDEWSIELYAKFPTTFNSNGEYLSNWSNASSTSGFEFFNTSSSHGFKIIKHNGTVKTASSNTALSTTSYTHIVVTHKDGDAKYYVNGVLAGSVDGVGAQASWVNDITIGGRGAGFSAGAEVAPSTIRSFYIDEFAMYNKALTAESIKNRYITTQIKPITSFPHLYGNDQSAKQIIDAIALGDFGRFFVDENNKFQYYHYYRFFEPTIEQHSVSQKTISDESHIQSGEYNVQLQVNKLTVNVTDQSPMTSGRQALWSPPDNSTLGVVTLSNTINSTSLLIPVNSTNNPPFPTSGYLQIDSEIVKYTSIDDNNFILGSVEDRAQFDTVAVTHGANTPVREARYYQVKYDNAPAFNIYKPFVTAIEYTIPPKIVMSKYTTNAYTAELILSASTSVVSGNIAYIQGTNPKTEEEDFTRISGVPVKKQEGANQIKAQSATLSEDIRKYGLKEVVIDNEYIYTAAKAQEIADFLISKFKEPIPILNIASMAIPTIQIGDRITISSLRSLDIINTDYWVVSHSLTIGDTLEHSIVLRKVS
jgi:hypothetical protein